MRPLVGIALVFIGFMLAPASRLAANDSIPWCRAHPPPIGPQRQASLAGGREVPWTLGTKRVLIYRIKFAEAPEAPPPEEEIETAMQEVADAYWRMSFGKFSLEWQMTPELVLFGPPSSLLSNLSVILDAAQAAASAVGFDPQQFDLDMVIHGRVAGSYPGGEGVIGHRGARSASANSFVLLHEIGHNLGLAHANSWNTSGPDVSPRQAPPFPSYMNEVSSDLPFDPASLAGHDDVMSFGRVAEYGDLFDPMGIGHLDIGFNAAYRRQLSWLSGSDLATITTSGVRRLYSLSADLLTPGRAYALRIAKPVTGRFPYATTQFYWVECQGLEIGNRLLPLREGVEVHWRDEHEAGNSLLIDATPGSTGLFNDAPLQVGCTLSDPGAELYITPVAYGSDGPDRWFDVDIEFGPFPSNASPVVSLNVSETVVAPGATVILKAAATDPDNDPLAYSWDFGDGTLNSNVPQIEKNWMTAGDYVVRCTVSDRRGGSVSRHVLIRVGAPNTFRIAGRVRDELGRSVAGVRIHNGRVFRTPGDLPEFRITETDAEGAYVLTNLEPGVYEVGAFKYGLQTARSGEDRPVSVGPTDAHDVDFISRPLATVDLSVSRPAVAESEIGVEILFTRSGPTQEPLEVPYQLNGVAIWGVDYATFPDGSVTIQAGERTAVLKIQPLADPEFEGPEDVIITAVPRREMWKSVTVASGPALANFFHPGWELRTQAGESRWSHTDPEFALTRASQVTFRIRDSTPFDVQVLTASPANITGREAPRVDTYFSILRRAAATPALEVYYSLSGFASNGIDYEWLPGSVTIPAGETDVKVPVVPIADDLPEGAEYALLTLLPNPHYFIQGTEAAIEITDGEQQLQLTLSIGWEGLLMLHLYGKPGLTYIIETSDTLNEAWRLYRTELLTETAVAIRLPNTGADSIRYYRARQLGK